ncbi:prolyl oligopeptidase family serine peptidase [uncultured Aquimarina sp.]|uniref:alpha/beta hydrolase family protein n=1 Tax=uncultured Aquimarina sp. TaxID=575652 RepID=UPI002618CF10|nr:prolyl oligopeptidase family serine peptidase [uncultured Aquimarina sp.]
MKSSFMVIILLGFLTACDKDDFLDNFDNQILFATPTEVELNAISQDWTSRDLSPDDYRLEQIIELTSNGAILKIVSYRVNGFKEYGALIIPESSIPLPIRMQIFGFSKEVTTNSFRLNLNDDSDLPFIFAIPALRGQSLRITINNEEYTTPTSEGRHCDAFDGATDDALAFLNIIESTETNADFNRVAVNGGSRGGTVALLMGEHDERIKRVVGVVAPTNMLELTSRNENDTTYQCQFLQELVSGNITIEEARYKMIASSPIYFAKNLPLTQLHMAENDQNVPLSQGEQLLDVMTNLGLGESFELFVYENRTHSNIGMENQELTSRIQQFLSQL